MSEEWKDHFRSDRKYKPAACTPDPFLMVMTVALGMLRCPLLLYLIG